MPQQIRYCTVLGCSNSNSQNTISLHHLPSGVKNVDRRKKWREALYLSESERCAVCINHFDKSDVTKRNGRNILSSKAVPIYFLGKKINNILVLSSDAYFPV